MKELKDGREFFDGDPVDLYEGRFTGPFVIDEANGASLSNGDLVTFLVTARVETPKFSYARKTGNLKRSNAMKVQYVKPISADKARFMYDSLGEEVDGVNDGIIEDAPIGDDATATTADPTPLPIQDNFFDEEESEEAEEAEEETDLGFGFSLAGDLERVEA